MDKQEVEEPLSDTMSPIERIRQFGNSVRRTVRNQSSVHFSRLLNTRPNESINEDSYIDEDDLLSVEFHNSNVRHNWTILILLIFFFKMLFIKSLG